MNVLVIFEEIPERDVLIKGDESWLDFHGIYIGDSKSSQEKQNQLEKRVYDSYGNIVLEQLDFEKPLDITSFDKIIKCGLYL